jgi:hypothetical protein
MTPPTRAPTADELLADPTVLHALGEAWEDSAANDPVMRHEEGGWIYIDLGSGQISVVRASPGHRSMIDLTQPPWLAGKLVVGKFHTHPNPTAEGWYGGPSPGDVRADTIHGVPDLIRPDDGTYLSGPLSRRGGLTGRLGYPA